MASKMLVYVDIDWDSQRMDDQVDDMDRRLDDMRPIFREMQDYFERNWSENFLSNGLRVGGWQPLDAEYAAWKAQHFPGAPTLVRTGSLFNSIRSLRGAPNEINRKNATFGTNIKYAKFHTYGTSKMPKREFIYEPASFRRDWGDRIVKYVVDGDS